MFVFDRSFAVRALSALILAPIVLGVVWYGREPFYILVGLALLICLYEGVMLTAKFRAAFLLVPMMILYITAAALAILHIRGVDLLPLVMLMLAVWSSDTCAYFTGKTLGGPKLAPYLSPNKTWSGLMGGMVASTVIFVLFELINGTPYLWLMAVMTGLAIGLGGQVGDLMISALKRRAGVKDTGHLIPGHGGLLDRIDALLFCALLYWPVLKVIGS